VIEGKKDVEGKLTDKKIVKTNGWEKREDLRGGKGGKTTDMR